MSGQEPVDPFHVNSDVKRDTRTVTKKVRVGRGNQLNARLQYAQADAGGSVNAVVHMPYEGGLQVVVDTGSPPASPPNNLVVKNPFVKPASYVRARLIGGGAVQVVNKTYGQFEIAAPVAGTYLINVRNKARN